MAVSAPYIYIYFLNWTSRWCKAIDTEVMSYIHFLILLIERMDF